MNQPSHQDDYRIGTGAHQFASDSETGKSNLPDVYWLPVIVRLTYVFLFTYTGYSKLDDIDSFIRSIQKIPFLGNFAAIVGWGIPILELILAMCMVIPFGKLRRIAFGASVTLMGIFTLYFLLMMALVKERLCSCGGVIESLGWIQHLTFNCIILILGLWSIKKNN